MCVFGGGFDEVVAHVGLVGTDVVVVGEFAEGGDLVQNSFITDLRVLIHLQLRHPFLPLNHLRFLLKFLHSDPPFVTFKRVHPFDTHRNICKVRITLFMIKYLFNPLPYRALLLFLLR